MACALFICGNRKSWLAGWPEKTKNVFETTGSRFLLIADLLLRTCVLPHADTASVITAPLAGEAFPAVVLLDFSCGFLWDIYLPIQSRNFDKRHVAISLARMRSA